MNTFHRVDDALYVENVSLAEVGERFGTPAFVYSRAAIESAYKTFDDALSARPHLICYAMKANSNLAILNLLARLGAGFDIVSGGELARVSAAGGDMRKVVFSGVGKQPDEMAAALEAQIKCFNVESLAELEVLATVAAAHGVVAPVSIRVNPDVDAKTHPYILDLGGGQGIRYQDEQPIDLGQWAAAMEAEIGARGFELLVEPGRSIVGNAGALLTQVNYLKHSDARNFAVVDAAMNDLIRPALYSAWQQITEVKQRDTTKAVYDVVGPVCESSDFLGKDRELSLQEGDMLAVLSSGAYGFCMSSNYNSRPRACEVLVDGDAMHLIRERESVESLFAGERLLP